MRTHARAPCLKLLRLYFSFGEWMRSSSRPKPIRSESSPSMLWNWPTTGIDPPKTNWARPITEPPFYGYSLRTGVTFTYLGLKVDERAQCSVGNRPVANLWAAGETMAGSILGQGYLAGFGMTIGTVFGRIAGKEAAAHANAS